MLAHVLFILLILSPAARADRLVNGINISSGPLIGFTFSGVGLDSISIYSVHDATETLEYTLLGEPGIEKIWMPLVTEGRYSVRGRSAGGETVAHAIIDRKPPVSTASELSPTSCTLHGIASDDNSGVDAVAIALRAGKSPILWWDGKAWSSIESWLLAKGRESWEWRVPDRIPETPGKIEVLTSAVDLAGNREIGHLAAVELPRNCR